MLRATARIYHLMFDSGSDSGPEIPPFQNAEVESLVYRCNHSCRIS